jgi:Protein of unknown function (DUF1592)/Protein of unknown function (DUF1588)/Protein of unknown function (DUF1595)/Protein of unknown function (DUF1585)/Protein of unknown function (DUF1587)
MAHELSGHGSLTRLSSQSLLLVAVLGCTGTIENPNGPGSPGSGSGPGTPGVGPGTGTPGTGTPGTGTPGTGTPGAGTGTPGTSTPGVTPPPAMPTLPGTGVVADPNAAGPMPLRRLNRLEYNNTVRDLLGILTKPADAFALDLEAGFAFRRAGLVSSLDASNLRDAAEQIATAANITTLATCAVGAAAEDACAKAFITSFGGKAFRRPVNADETARLVALYQAGRTTVKLDYPGAVRLLIEAMLQSAPFLYHWELGPAAPLLEGKLVRLGPYEVASRLSYFLWGSMPDQALFDAAKANQLATPAAVDAQARRLLADPKARTMVSAFFEQWLGLDQVATVPKAPAVYPEFTDELKAAMSAETQAFATNVVFDGDGLLGTLLTGKFSFVSKPLGPLYGLTVQSTSPLRTDLDAAQRAGLFTQAAFLTVTGSPDGSNPVRRGKKILERMLCGTLPPPPPVVPPPKPASAGGTTRQRFADHDKQACALGCHGIMDPLGFAFEHYDGIGKYRTMDNGLPVDSTGSVKLGGTDHPFADAIELAGILAASQEARSCFVTQWARFALGRGEVDADQASLDRAAMTFATANGAVRELLVSVATSRSFLYRSPAAGETP